MAKRPNFLFFITDQQRADYLACAGHPVLRTPNIDSIAGGGRRFDRFYVATPVCMPNRSTLMTGRMPSLHGVRSNGTALTLRANTFVDLMRTHGYRTALLGKSHLQNMTGMPAIVERPEAPEDHLPPPAPFMEAMRRSDEDGPVDAESPQGWRDDPGWDLHYPFYGFEHVDLCTEHGDKVGGHYWQWLKERHADPDSLRGPKNALPHDYTMPQAWRTAVPEELYPTRYVADRTVDFLESHASRGRRCAVLRHGLVPRSAPPLHPAGQILGDVQPRRHDARCVLLRQQRAAAACQMGARDPRGGERGHRQPVAVRGLRARGARGLRAHLRHDRDDRRCGGRDPRPPSTASASPRTRW